MKNIVVPTDFSANAKNALYYAIELANRMDECFIHLIHIFAYRSDTGLMASVNDFMRKRIDENLSEIKAEVLPSLFNGTHLKVGAFEGYPIDTITEYAETVSADFVVMGTQGASGLKGIFMGTNTTGVIKLCSRPVIAVPSAYRFQKIEHIAFAIDAAKLGTDEVTRPLIKLAKLFQSKVHIVHVERIKEAVTIDASVDIHLSEVNHDFHQIQNRDVNKGLNKFVTTHGIDVLCMLHRRRSFLHRLLFESVTSAEALHCPVPLLILHERQEDNFL